MIIRIQNTSPRHNPNLKDFKRDNLLRCGIHENNYKVPLFLYAFSVPILSIEKIRIC